MLETFRAFSRTWFGKILFAFLMLGLAGFGISNVVLDFGSNNVATVGSQEITTRDFQRAYSQALTNYARQAGRQPTDQEAMAMGIPIQVLYDLGADAALNQLGENLNIGVSDTRLSKMLREDPSFGDVLGKFDPQNFALVLRQAGYTEEEYFNLQRNAARRQQLAQGLFLGSPVPQAAIELVSRYSGDKRTLDYFTLSASSMTLDVPAPTDADLEAYLKEHQADFRTVETRKADILVLTPDTLAATIEISDADIATEYEATKAQLTRPEKRTLTQVALSTPEQQKLFADGKAAGRSFDELVAEARLTPSSLGTLARADISDASLAEAAFSLAQGEFSIIPGIGGQRAVAVTAIEPGGEVSLADATADIRQRLALRDARDGYADTLDQIEELRAALQPLPQIAQRFNLPIATVDVTADGAALSAVQGLPDDQRQRVAGAIFAATEGALPPTVALSSNSNVWFDLKSIDPARDQTLAEVRDQLSTAWTLEKTEAAVQAQVDAAMEKLKSGTSFEEVAASYNQFPQLSQPIDRGGEQIPPLDQKVASAAFQGGEGFVGTTTNGDGDHVVFRVVEIVSSAEPANAEIDSYIADQRQNTLYSDFRTALRDSIGMPINQKTLQQLLTLETGN